MSVLGRLFGVESRSQDVQYGYGDPSEYPASDGKWGDGMVWSNFAPSSAVTTSSAMRLSSVFACLRLLSEAIATLPLDTFTRSEGQRTPYPAPGYLTFQPPQASRIDYLSQLVLSLLTDGNAFVATPRNSMGEVLDLIVLDPYRVEISKAAGRLRYFIDANELDPVWDLMHIPGMKLPGHLRGLSPIAYARETIGLGLAAQRFGQSFFENGALPGAMIEAPGKMSDGAVIQLRETWNNGHRGVANGNRLGILTEGAKLSKVSIPPNEAQFLETRQFQVPDVARIYGVPPHLIADASNSTSWGSGLAEQNLAFGQFSLRPWITRIEDAHTRLLTTQGLPNVFVKLNMDALLRASAKDRYEVYALGVKWRITTPNECRAYEDQPPIAGGDQFPEDVVANPDAASVNNQPKGAT